MIVQDAITQCDSLKPNQYDVRTKLAWLSDLDTRVTNDILSLHTAGLKFTPYKEEDLANTLLVLDPYSKVYVLYLSAQIDYFNADFKRYNNSMIMFEKAYQDYANYFIRMNLPLQSNSIEIGWS